MRKVTKEEHNAHAKELKRIRAKITRANERYQEGDITKSKLKKLKAEAQREEFNYLKDSKIILFFGQLFIGE